MKVRCKNCRLEFNADDNARIEKCPRCSSKSLDFKREPPKEAVPGAVKKDDKRIYTSAGVVYGETKEAWKSFHAVEAKACQKCGGTEFARDFRRKEKVCKKCGEIFSLPRRFG